MTWQETRGTVRATATAVREGAHTDDSKHRLDDASNVVPRKPSKWLALTVAGAVLLVGGGATAVAISSRGGHSRTPHATATAGAKTGTAPTAAAQDPKGGRFSLSGTFTVVASAYRDAPRGTFPVPGFSIEFDCAASACTVTSSTIKVYEHHVLTATGTGRYAARYVQSRSESFPSLATPLTVHYDVVLTLVVHGSTASFVARSGSDFAGNPQRNHVTVAPAVSRVAGPIEHQP